MEGSGFYTPCVGQWWKWGNFSFSCRLNSWHNKTKFYNCANLLYLHDLISLLFLPNSTRTCNTHWFTLSQILTSTKWPTFVASCVYIRATQLQIFCTLWIWSSTVPLLTSPGLDPLLLSLIFRAPRASCLPSFVSVDQTCSQVF